MKKILFAIISFTFLVASCSKDSEFTQEGNDIFGFTSLVEAKEHLGVYADIFIPTNGSMYIRSTGYANSPNEKAEIFGRYINQPNESRSDGGIYELEDIKLTFDENSMAYLPEEGDLTNDEKLSKINSLFGKENQFNLIKDGKSIVEFKQYLPEKINVDVSSSTPYPNSSLNSVERENFKISWNEDTGNNNGIVAYLWWNGDRTDLGANEQGQGEVVNRSVKLDDNGEAIISPEFFSEIPKNAIVTIFFIRGNVDITEFNNKSYQFYSITQQKHNFVLAN